MQDFVAVCYINEMEKRKRKKGVKRTCPLKRYNIHPNNNSKNMIILVKSQQLVWVLCVSYLLNQANKLLKWRNIKNPPKRQHISITGESIKTVPSLCTSIEFKPIIQSPFLLLYETFFLGRRVGPEGQPLSVNPKEK